MADRTTFKRAAVEDDVLINAKGRDIGWKASGGAKLSYIYVHMSNILWLLTALFEHSSSVFNTKLKPRRDVYMLHLQISFPVSQLRAAQSERGNEADESSTANAV